MLNPWPDWFVGHCDRCGEVCVNQYATNNPNPLQLWRATYWTDKVICTACADLELAQEEVKTVMPLIRMYRATRIWDRKLFEVGVYLMNGRFYIVTEYDRATMATTGNIVLAFNRAEALLAEEIRGEWDSDYNPE